MTQSNAPAGDTFEKAREAFFGTVKTSSKPGAFAAGFAKPRNEPASEKSEGSPTDQREAVRPLVSARG